MLYSMIDEAKSAAFSSDKCVISRDEAVSYTHLDVYKRQRRARLWVVNGYADDTVLERAISAWLPIPSLEDVGTLQALSLIHI